MFITSLRKIYYLHVRSFIFIVSIIPSIAQDNQCAAHSSGVCPSRHALADGANRPGLAHPGCCYMVKVHTKA